MTILPWGSTVLRHDYRLHWFCALLKFGGTVLYPLEPRFFFFLLSGMKDWSVEF